MTCNAALRDVVDEASFDVWSDEEVSSAIGNEMPILPKVPMPCLISCGCRGNSVLGAMESQNGEINLVRTRELPGSCHVSCMTSPRRKHHQWNDPLFGNSGEASPGKWADSPRFLDGRPRSETGLALFLRAAAASSIPSMRIPSGFQSQQCTETGKQVLLHEQSDIIVLDMPLRPPRVQVGAVVEHSGDVLLFYYTHEEAFRSILRSHDSWECLAKVNHVKTCTFNGECANCGKGIYCTAMEPAQFGTQRAVLLNNCTNRADLEGQLRFIASCRKDAAFCVPLLVPRRQATNVQLESTPEMVYGPGRNISGETLRKDRDIWVVALTLVSPRTTAASWGDGEGRCLSIGKVGRRRSTEGLHVSFAADGEERWYYEKEDGPWEWLELCMPWLCLCALSLLRPSTKGTQWPSSTKSHVSIKRHKQMVL